MFFRNAGHAHRFYECFYTGKGTSPGYLSAIYLLTAYGDLWLKAREGITATEIDFGKMNPQGMRTKAYILYSAAKDVLMNTSNLTLYDLYDCRSMGEDTLNLILNAIQIKRKGFKEWISPSKRE